MDLYFSSIEGGTVGFQNSFKREYVFCSAHSNQFYSVQYDNTDTRSISKSSLC